MSRAPALSIPNNSLAHTYAQLATALLGSHARVCILDANLASVGCSEGLAATTIADWLAGLGWPRQARHPVTRTDPRSRQCLTAIPLLRTDDCLLGVLCVEQVEELIGAPDGAVRDVAQLLKPCIDCLHRELAGQTPASNKLKALTERTAELEWLFKITNDLKGHSTNRHIIEELLSAATGRLHSGLGMLYIPGKHLCLSSGVQPPALTDAWEQSRDHLHNWAQRQRRPLVINTAGRSSGKMPPCKILSVPIMRAAGQVIGILSFFNTLEADDFSARDTFLARHLGRQMASIVEAHFDLMTGLYTRDGLDQIYSQLLEQSAQVDRSVIYVDIDHMCVVNETHGFELGNELIVRIAELLSPPCAPAGAFAGRISGDRFVLVLPECGPDAAIAVAGKAQAGAAALSIGPRDNPIEVSISCGIASLVDMPQGLARSIAAAEIACKMAKSRGRNRTELYACEDNSMMRRHEDVVAVGQLRTALKTDGFLLYAQRIVPLQDLGKPDSYEILLRMRTPDGEIHSPAALISAANQFQLLPSIDRWVCEHALQQLAPYRNTIRSCGMSFALNVSGQSIADQAFIQQLSEQLRAASLPRGCVTIEITEQAAVTNLARANSMLQVLKILGCEFALDDFGTGANSLAILKALQIGRVKIDGSFVRDIATNARSMATIRGIMELAKGMKLETVAEYVENDEIAKVVRSLGIDYAQGYAFSIPEPLEKVLSGLARDESRRMRKIFLEN